MSQHNLVNICADTFSNYVMVVFGPVVRIRYAAGPVVVLPRSRLFRCFIAFNFLSCLVASPFHASASSICLVFLANLDFWTGVAVVV